MTLVGSGLAAAAWVLAWLTPEPAELAATLRDPQEVAVGAGVDVLALAAAATACWVALTWLVLAMTASAAAALPGRCGRWADRVVAVAVPAAARRVLAVALGLSVATASSAVPAVASVLPQQRAAAVTVDLDWPVATERSGRPPTQTRKPSAVTAREGGSRERGEVVVLRGDSLWTIAERHLPPGASEAQIAAVWPQWYRANRSAVGPDPDLLLPGQRLVPPPMPSGGQP